MAGLAPAICVFAEERAEREATHSVDSVLAEADEIIAAHEGGRTERFAAPAT